MQGPAAAWVADPSAIWRDSLARLLSRAGFDVVVTAATQAEVREALKTGEPRLLVTEAIWPDDGRGDWVAECARVLRSAALVVVTETPEPPAVVAAFAAGAAAYLMKSALLPEVGALLAGVASEGARDVAPRGLSSREFDVLRLVSLGLTNSEVATRLWLTPPTVKFHLANIYRKLDVANRTQAARWAMTNLPPLGAQEETATG